jgi:hypothetical protein
MASAERSCQIKIQNLEIGLINYFHNVHRKKNIKKKHIEDMVQSSRGERNKKEDGFYMFTIDLNGKESHGILLYKETQHDGKNIFYIYEPNGKKNFNSRYSFSIRSEHEEELNLDMSPNKSINDEGHCAVWCIILIILWNSFETTAERWAALDIYHTCMRSSSDARNKFITGIFSLFRGKNFDSELEVIEFVEEVTRRIQALQVVVLDS